MKNRMCLRYHLSVCLWMIASIAWAQTNRALLVSISNYPDESGWEEIHAANDVLLVRSLLGNCGYRDKDITILADAQATKQNIIRSLQNLYNTTQPGDYVHLHFSCHGQQMMDDNGDEEDGVDEALIPYDALFWYLPEEYEGENHLRDDELGEWIRRLRHKAGGEGHITVVLDACHSGTGNRLPEADDYIRGTGYIFAPDDYVPSPGKHQELSLRLKPETGLAPTAVFSACLAEETNFEHFDARQSCYYGLLTFAFCETMREVFPTTAHSLATRHTPVTVDRFAQLLRQKMQALTAHKKKRTQTPYMECTSPQDNFRIGLESHTGNKVSTPEKTFRP